MKMLTKVIVLIGLALFLANASFAQQVKTDYDRAANFSQYKTYSWMKVQTPDPLWVDRIKAACYGALRLYGWEQNASWRASQLSRSHVKPRHSDLNNFYGITTRGFRWRGLWGRCRSHNYSRHTYTVGTTDTTAITSMQCKIGLWRNSVQMNMSLPRSKSETRARELEAKNPTDSGQVLLALK